MAAAAGMAVHGCARFRDEPSVLSSTRQAPSGMFLADADADAMVVHDVHDDAHGVNDSESLPMLSRYGVAFYGCLVLLCCTAAAAAAICLDISSRTHWSDCILYA